MPFPNIEDAFRYVRAELEKQAPAIQAVQEKTQAFAWSPRQLWHGEFAQDQKTNLLFWGTLGFFVANFFDRQDFLSDDLAWFGLLFLGVWYQFTPLPAVQAAKSWEHFYQQEATLQDMFRAYFFPNYEFVPQPNLQVVRRTNPFLDNSYKKKPAIVFHNPNKGIALILHEHIQDPDTFCLSIFWVRDKPFAEKMVNVSTKNLNVPRHHSLDEMPIQTLPYFPNIDRKLLLRSESRAQTALLVQQQETFLLELAQKNKVFYLKADSENLLLTFFNVLPDLLERNIPKSPDNSETRMQQLYDKFLYLYRLVDELEQAFSPKTN